MTTEEKRVKKYSAMFAAALKERGFSDADEKAGEFSGRLTKMYASDAYRKHNIYPTISTPMVYAVIAMCLTLKPTGLSKNEIIDIVNTAFRSRKKAFGRLVRAIDRLPFAWSLAKKWNIADHDGRVRDKSITYDRFEAADDRVSYKISKCQYVEMFDYYGVREYCKIFCMTDTELYSNLTRHVKFIRHSDLSDGDSCNDEVIKRG